MQRLDLEEEIEEGGEGAYVWMTGNRKTVSLVLVLLSARLELADVHGGGVEEVGGAWV